MNDKSIKNTTKNTIWTFPGEKPDMDDLKLSCLMRIADAVETLTKKYERLESDLNWYKQHYDEQCREVDRLIASRAGYKAAVTRLKNKGLRPKPEAQ